MGNNTNFKDNNMIGDLENNERQIEGSMNIRFIELKKTNERNEENNNNEDKKKGDTNNKGDDQKILLNFLYLNDIQKPRLF